MESKSESRGPQLWNGAQRTALLAVLIPLTAFFLIRYWLHPAFVSDPQATSPERAAELLDRIDPNTADAATLGALPTLGEKRAKLIIDYREHYHRLQPLAGAAYKKPEDLLRIHGIGMATVDALRPYLAFDQQSASAPSTAGAND